MREAPKRLAVWVRIRGRKSGLLLYGWGRFLCSPSSEVRKESALAQIP